MLQLHKTESEDGASAQEYAEFMHAPRKRFTDYGESASSASQCLCVQLVMVGHQVSHAAGAWVSGSCPDYYLRCSKYLSGNG